MKRSFLVTFGILFLGVSIIGGYILKVNLFTKKANSTGGQKPSIVTSFYPLYFFTTQITLDKVAVHNITPAGAEPHDYEPTAQDIARIENSQLLILNGGKLEAWGDKIKSSLGLKTTFLTVGDALANQNTTEEDGSTVLDPHIWLNPMMAKKMAEKIVKSIKQMDPANSSYYDKNARSLENRLDDLHKKYVQGLSTCKKRNIITAHAAFGYLAREYGLNQVFIAGLSPEEEPSPRKMVEIAKFAKENNVDYIFFESLVSPKLSETIAFEIGAKTLALNPLEGLSDEEIRNGKNYFTEMENNLANLRIALQCQ